MYFWFILFLWQTNKDTMERSFMSKLYYETHWSKKKNDWVNEQARTNYETAKARIESLKEAGEEVDEDKIYSKVLGQKKNYIRGHEPGPKPDGLRVQQLAAREKELAKREKALLEKELQLADKEVLVVKESAEKEVEALKEQARKEVQTLKEQAEKGKMEAEEALKEVALANIRVGEMKKCQEEIST